MQTKIVLHSLRGVAVAVLLVGLLAVGAFAPTVFAHGELEEATPAPDSVIAEAPTTVEIWFTQELFRRDNANRIEVFAADGTQVDMGDSVLDDDDRRHVIVSLQPDLAPGVYTVHWYNLSLEDGHEEDATYTFTLDPNAPATTPTSEAGVAPTATLVPVEPTQVPATPTPVPASGGIPGCGGAALIPFLLGGVWVAQRRRG